MYSSTLTYAGGGGGVATARVLGALAATGAVFFDAGRDGFAAGFTALLFPLAGAVFETGRFATLLFGLVAFRVAEGAAERDLLFVFGREVALGLAFGFGFNLDFGLALGAEAGFRFAFFFAIAASFWRVPQAPNDKQPLGKPHDRPVLPRILTISPKPGKVASSLMFARYLRIHRQDLKLDR